ncbi:MAG TPA: Hsp20/alpha crystallin family protein [Gemmatimonadales bacterium]|nr:Hsp20/alpha crystallin family protein [Gemmatimonadales bacterium]
MFTLTNRPLWLDRDLGHIDRLLNEVSGVWNPQSGDATDAATWIPAVDVFESKDELRIVAELPGVKPEDVKLSVENAMLSIRGEKKQVAEESAEAVHRYERSYGSFLRSFRIPSTVDAERIQARYEHGVLTVTLPKAEKAKAREIAVEVR